MTQEDLYKILEVPEDASDEKIKSAYREKVKIHHPDKQGGNEEEFKRVQNAYDILSDEKKRKEYDMRRQFGYGFDPNLGHFSMGGFGNLSDLFNAFRKGSAFHGMVKGRSRKYKFAITLEEVLSGKKATFNHKVQHPNGEETEEQKQIEFPKGIKNGLTYSISGMGDFPPAGHNGVRGDVHIQVVYEHENDIEVDDAGNVIKQMYVPYYDFLLGTTLEVSLIEGTKALVKLDPLSKNQMKFRLNGKGLPTNMGADERSDFFVIVNAQFPDKLSKEEEALLQKIKKLNKPKNAK